MKVKVLGAYGRFAPKGCATNSYLVTSGEASILLDCGSGAVSRLSDEEIAGLDAVILTHFHGDHIADYLTLQYRFNYLFGGKRPKFLTFLPKNPACAAELLTADKSFEYRFIERGLAEKIGCFEVEFFPMVHPVETYSARLCDGNCALAYTSDDNGDGDYGALEGADAVIGDACVTLSDSACPHIPVERLARLCRGKKLFLGHLDKLTEVRVLKAARAVESSAELCKEGTTYTIEKTE